MARLVGMEYWDRVNEALGTATLRSVCEKAGISYDTVRGARCRNRLLRLDTANQLAEALGTTNDYLMGGETPETKPVAEPEDEKLQELISLCKDNPKLIDTLLSVAHITLGK